VKRGGGGYVREGKKREEEGKRGKSTR